ncbi:MAG TPA: serine/threonine-protein kinase [Gemmataceae bacterium]|nr:serine/threonine-protein kinase [Gemmataceae bacterium]
MPSPEKLAAFVEAARASGLLPPADMEAFAKAAAEPGADAETLIKDLVRRGLLTSYQARKLWKGQGADLFLSQYILLDKLGEGGMGEVFRARHQRLDRDVALKVMRRERLANPEAVKRFRREIKAAARLAHENVVLAYDADQAGDVHFFAMEFVEGTTLDNRVNDKGPLPVGEACEYVRQIAMGLQHAHEAGLIHRDVKPSNMLLSKDGIVKISDLGLVLVDDPETPESLGKITKEGLTVGTPDFLAPEQARNPRKADIRADIYALGCTFYYLLIGDFPYPGGTPTEKMFKHAREPFPEVTRADVPDEVRAVIAKMTAKRPEQRYQIPAEVALELEPHARKPSQLTPPPLPGVAPEEPLTEDSLPTQRRERDTDSRFRLSESATRRKVRRKGCLGVALVIGVVGLGVVIGLAS